jgi:hypothetical protein
MGVSGFLSLDWLQIPLIHAKKLPEILKRAPKALWTGILSLGIPGSFLCTFQPAGGETMMRREFGRPAFHGCAQAGLAAGPSGLFASPVI